MKTRVTMIATLKSGAKVKDSVKLDDNTREAAVELINKIYDLVGSTSNDDQDSDLNVGALTFGKTSIRWSQIAAITFKERLTI